ncbi:ribose transport system substrate-binding protein [Mumia flava]|uniref:Ribose transport system substrate-binding protein n=1 Tax=Mumia flava TaxID=1348852 RepID=A0A0B2B982_9ACTN|nr:ABC transporter substrate-binding protein [Mumia flava]PJJ53707.1 ribose transport system substrate-binding protein [Mumia flava]
MNIRRIGAAVAALPLLLAMSACGDDSASGGSGDEPYVAIVSKGFQHQFWQAVKQGAEQQAEKEGVRITFEGPATETDVEDQVNMLSNALAKSPDAIGFAALDSKAAEPLLQQAQSQDIPVIAFDSGVDSDIPVTTAATDNKAAAAEAAKHMAELIGNQGKVAMVVHDQTSKSGTDRRDGFVEWMEQNAPDVELLPVQYGDGDQTKSADITKSIIQSNPDVAGIYGSNEGSAIGVVKGVEESGKQGITVVGFDSGQAQIDAINNGVMAGAITQNPVGMGEELVKAAVKAIDGEDLPDTIDTGFYWYDKSNIDDAEIQAVLYQ